MTVNDIRQAQARLEAFLGRHTPQCDDPDRPKAVSRRALQHIAQGRCTKVEAVVLLMYFARRISQVKAMQKLEEGERYSRFTLRELEQLSGSPKANLSRALQKLRHKGILGTVEVAKQNENQYGLLYIDGPLLSLVRSRQAVAGRCTTRTTTPPRRNDNAPTLESTTLRKDSPKRIPKKNRGLRSGLPPTSRETEWNRILLRGQQMKEMEMRQAV